MSNVLKTNVKIRQSVDYVTVKQSPIATVLSKKGISVDSSSYQEYSFTGALSEILSKEEIELNKGIIQKGGLVSGTNNIYWAGQQISTTRSRLEGDIYELKVRVQNLVWEDTEDPDEEDVQTGENMYGSAKEPRTATVSVTAAQQSILFSPPYKNLDKKQLGCIKMWMNGSSPYTPVPFYSAGGGLKNITLEKYTSDLGVPQDLIDKACKKPVYYVPNVNITIRYWKSTPISGVGEVGSVKTPPGDFKIAKGYTSIFMGATSSKSASGRGYVIEETYSIGQYDSTDWESGGTGGTGGTSSTN